MKDTKLKFLHVIKSFDFLRPGDILNNLYPVLDISEDEIILGKGNSGDVYAIINKLDCIAVTGETDISNLSFYYCIHSFNDFLEVMSRYKEGYVLELTTFDHRTFTSSSSLDIVETNDEIYIISKSGYLAVRRENINMNCSYMTNRINYSYEIYENSLSPINGINLPNSSTIKFPVISISLADPVSSIEYSELLKNKLHESVSN